MSTEPALNPPLRGAGRKPDWRFLLAHPAHAVALGFGSGLAPVAPGTAGTLFAWLAWTALPRATDDAT
ncbi:MAG TPA: phosphatidylglycerophosphatase A, partial [Caldimonas sp.]